MVDAGLSFGAGLLIGGFSLMVLWGLLWSVVGTVGLARQTCGWAIPLSAVSSSVMAALSMWVMVWFIDQARLSSVALQIGLLGVPLGLMGASFGRLEDGRRIGQAFVEGSRMMMQQLLRVQQEGCGHCHEKPCEEQP